MGKSIFFIAFEETTYQRGQTGLNNFDFSKIQSLFPEIGQLQLSEIDGMIGVFARGTENEKKGLSFKVTEFRVAAASMRLCFSLQGEMDLSSGELKRRARAILQATGRWDGQGYLPRLCLFTEAQTDQLLHHPPEEKKDRLEMMKQANDWLGIYQLYSPIEQLPHKPEIWNDSEKLSSIGFACGKLAETSEIPRDIFQDETKKRNFLKQQDQYRRETEMLRQRCVDMAPNNARYLSSLAYLFYQNATELNQPRGRRDGNIRQEIQQALEWFDRALEIDPTRITDLYRKGYLLAEILPKQILFGRSLDNEIDKPFLANQSRNEGLLAFEKVIEIWETLPLEAENRKRYFKEYIKSLYHSGSAYHDLIINTWDETVFALHMKEGIPDQLHSPNLSNEFKHANLSHQFFVRCWQADNKTGIPLDESNLLETPSTGVEEGVYRLYWVGKSAFSLYWILSGYGQKDTPESLVWREKAEHFLSAALKLPWSAQKQRQKKDFIAEFLARVYISKNQPQESIRILTQQQMRNPDPFIRQTQSLALLMLERWIEARQILLEIEKDRANKDRWMTHFLIGCSFLEESKFSDAETAFMRAQQEAKAQGKETVDSILIGHAFVAYKSKDRQKAINYLQQACELNQNRLAVQKRLYDWINQTKTEDNSDLK